MQTTAMVAQPTAKSKLGTIAPVLFNNTALAKPFAATERRWDQNRATMETQSTAMVARMIA
jgi:hypothetical protein